MKKVLNMQIRDLLGLTAKIPDPTQKAALIPKLTEISKEMADGKVSSERMETLVEEVCSDSALSSAATAMKDILETPEGMGAFAQAMLEFWSHEGGSAGEAVAKPLVSRPGLEQKHTTPEEAAAWAIIHGN